MQQITASELKELMAAGKAPQLLDVREDWEREAYNIGGLHVPMSELGERLSEVPKDEDVVVYCEKGIRSTILIQRLEGYGFHKLINLQGGMKAWKE
jgi:adenylyltransferase/sulfurtransferase